MSTLTVYEPTILKTYGLVKTYKPEIPIRSIISVIETIFEQKHRQIFSQYIIQKIENHINNEPIMVLYKNKIFQP